MKKLFRTLFVILGVVALTVLGIQQIGGTPISKGYDTGFEWTADRLHSRLRLSADPGGDMLCRIELKLSRSINDLNAQTSAGDQLTVSPLEKDGEQWYTVSKNGDKLDWKSGTTIDLSSSSNQPVFDIKDWYIYHHDKFTDSRRRAKWRRVWFWISLVSIPIACTGLALERLSKNTTKPERFSPEICIKLLIESIEGKDDKESASMRSVLTKVLIEGTPVEYAIKPLASTRREQRGLGFKAAAHFRGKLENLISELKRYLDRVERR